MKQQKPVTLTHLKKNVWWWQRRGIQRYGIPGVAWDKLNKEAARNYELMRRSTGGKQFKKSYLELNLAERVFVHILWSNFPLPVVRFATSKDQFSEPGWTPVFPNPPIQWNVRLPDPALVKEFQRQIALTREMQGIQPPRHPLIANRHHSASWKYMEILDRQENGLGPFSDSERHMATEGKRKSRKLLNQFSTALKAHKARHNDSSPFALWDDATDATEFFNSK